MANPLREWFDSLDRLERDLPRDVLVLPAHGKPFRGAHIRLAQLRQEHLEGLDKLRRLCREPRRAVDVFPALFKSRIDDGNLIMATGEALSHLRYLQELGEVQKFTDPEGVDWHEMRQ
jgi:glyoxylase-like metal-dependent hydrolase (beta-lactamase superfamily II)